MFSNSLLPLNPQFSAFHGFKKLLNKEYYIKIKLNGPYNPNSANLTLKQLGVELLLCTELELILEPYQEFIEQKWNQFNDFDSFWFELDNHIQQEISDKVVLAKYAELLEIFFPKGLTVTAPPTYYPTLLKDLDIVGWDNIVDLESDLTKFKFNLSLENKKFELKVKLPNDYPNVPPNVEIDIPKYNNSMLNLPSRIGENESWFTYILQSIAELVKRYIPFWEVTEEIDNFTTVLEPQPITPKDCFRRIALENLCSLEIEIDPDRPYTLPSFKFYGSEKKLMPLKNNLEKNIASWDIFISPLKNFKKILELEFYNNKSYQTVKNRTQECGICYTYRAIKDSADENKEDELGYVPTYDKFQAPTLLCNNPICSKIFHHKCLLESIKSLPSSRHSYKVWFGTCPYCNEPISVEEV